MSLPPLQEKFSTNRNREGRLGPGGFRKSQWGAPSPCEELKEALRRDPGSTQGEIENTGGSR
jgi:hypothetical protein